MEKQSFASMREAKHGHDWATNNITNNSATLAVEPQEHAANMTAGGHTITTTSAPTPPPPPLKPRKDRSEKRSFAVSVVAGETASMVTTPLGTDSPTAAPAPTEAPRASSATLIPVTDTGLEDSKQHDCMTNNSLHQMALNMANLSSPPGSKSYNKTLRVLRASKRFHIDMVDPIFASVTDNIASMLQGFGLEQVTNKSAEAAALEATSSNSTILIVETSFYGFLRKVRNYTDMPRIVIQTEQLEKKKKEGYEGYLRTCHTSPLCAVWDFSDYHLEWAKKNNMADSFLLLPLMHQSRLGGGAPVETLKPLVNRPLDVAFFGYISPRRRIFKRDIFNAAKAKGWKMRFEKNYDVNHVAETYADAKVCLIVHAWTANSAGEYHRLSEVATSGCIPVVESVKDEFIINVHEQCGGVVFAPLHNLIGAVDKVLEGVNNSNASLAMHSRQQWWRQGINWPEILTTIYDGA